MCELQLTYTASWKRQAYYNEDDWVLEIGEYRAVVFADDEDYPNVMYLTTSDRHTDSYKKAPSIEEAKTLAEKALAKLVAREGGNLERLS